MVLLLPQTCRILSLLFSPLILSLFSPPVYLILLFSSISSFLLAAMPPLRPPWRRGERGLGLFTSGTIISIVRNFTSFHRLTCICKLLCKFPLFTPFDSFSRFLFLYHSFSLYFTRLENRKMQEKRTITVLRYIDFHDTLLIFLHSNSLSFIFSTFRTPRKQKNVRQKNYHDFH